MDLRLGKRRRWALPFRRSEVPRKSLFAAVRYILPEQRVSASVGEEDNLQIQTSFPERQVDVLGALTC
ncbi:hypothetical protein SLE2022_162890 [Rubroshorea leprosula]